MKSLLRRIKYYIRRVYRLSMDLEKHENFAWEDLKKLHSDLCWKTGVFEEDRYLETIFSLAENTPGYFHYWIRDEEFHCMVRVLEGYNPEMTTDVFVLASHFNNLLKHGTVAVNVEASTVSYRLKQNVLIPSLYTGEIYNQIIMHHSTSQDVYWAFNQLVVEGEEPALIIADLLARKDSEEKEVEENKEH